MFDAITSIIVCVGSIATAVSLVFLIKQTSTLQKTYEYTTDWQCKEKAVELARYYKDCILSNVSYINTVLKGTDALSLLDKIRNGDINMFTRDELTSLVGSQINERIEEKIKNPHNLKAFILVRNHHKEDTHKPYNANDIMIDRWIQSMRKNSSANCSADINNVSNSEDNDSMSTEQLIDALYLEFQDIISDTLNNLEYFAMNFITGVADESVVFQSLHQTYLGIVRALYANISFQNANPKDKFYTNIIELYRIWAERDEENSRLANSLISPSSAVRK